MSARPKNRLAHAVGRAIGGVSLAASRHAILTLLALFAITGGLAQGLAHLDFEENLLLILPRGQSDTEANLRLHDHFPGHYSYVNINFKTDPQKWERWNRELPNRVPPERMQNPPYVGKLNATDEVYLRGLEGYLQFLRERAPPEVEIFNIAWQSHVKLVNYTNSYNPVSQTFDPDAYRLPGTDAQSELRFAANWQTVYASASKEVQTQASPDWSVTRSVYIFTPKNGTDEALDYNAIGQFMIDAFLAYKAQARNGTIAWDVFNLDESGITDAKIVDDAHQNRLARSELRVLGPLVGIFVFATLLLAFRSLRGILVSAGTLGMGVVWSFGFMGYMDIPLNVLNLTIVPLILGVGIDYSLHIVNAYLANKKRGLTDAEAFRDAGFHSGFAMFIATLTTIVGLVVMTFGPSLLIAQLGIVSAFGLGAIYLIAITFIPAAFTLLGSKRAGARYRPSRLMPALARLVHRNKAVVAVVIVSASAIAYVGAQQIEYETFGNPARNFPQGDLIRDWFDSGQTAFFGEGKGDYESNWVIIQGDITRPEVHDYIKKLQADLPKSELIRDDSVTSIVNLVKQWQSLKRGTPAALLNIGQESAQPGSTYPQTQEEIRQALDEMYACECMSVYTSLFINHGYDMTVILIDTGTGGNYEGAQSIIEEVRAVIARHDAAKPDDVQVNLGGYTVFSYLFIKYQMPWVAYMSIVVNVLVTAFVWIMTRDWRATLLIAALNGLTTLWWLAILPEFGIGLSITLTLPLIFIYCIGSDYGLHLLWDLHAKRDMNDAFAVTGKAVLFSAITDFGAFLLFVPMTNLMMRKSMIATALAILVMLVVTILLVPLVHRPAPEPRAPEAEPAEREPVPQAPGA